MKQELRTSLKVTGVFIVCVAAGLCLYFLFGHILLTALYPGQAFPLLNRLTGDRSPLLQLLAGGRSLPLGQYLDRADEMILRYAATALISFFFYLFFALVVRRLLKRDANAMYGPPRRSSGVRVPEMAGALLIYTLLTIAFFYSSIPHITSQLIGPPGDNMYSLWSMWWTRQAMQGKLNFLYTTSIFYPEGSSLLFTLNPYNQLVALAAGGPQPPVAVYNLLILSSFVLSGIGAFLLIRHFTDDTAAALLGGFVFAFSPWHFAHSLQHLSIATVQFIPFFVLFYIKTMEDGSKRNVAWASVFFLLITLCCWDYLVYAFFFMVAYYCITAYQRKRLRRFVQGKRFVMPRPIISSLIIMGGTLVVLSPLVVRMLFYGSQHSGVTVQSWGLYPIDFLGLFVPHGIHWLAGVPIVARINGSYAGSLWECVGYLGILCIGLVLTTNRVLAERAPRYVVLLLFFLLLCFGSNLRFAGQTLLCALPYAAIKYIPILSGARAPARAMCFAYLFLGVLVAIAFSYQLREGFLRRRKWVAALLALGICADFWTPCRQMTPVRLPPAYMAILGQEKEHVVDFGILDLPTGSGGNSFTGRYMMYQTLHRIPIVEGYVARKLTPCLLDSLEYHDLSVQKAQLCSAHVKYVVIHKQFITIENGTPEAFEREFARLEANYEKAFEDEENLVLRAYR